MTTPIATDEFFTLLDRSGLLPPDRFGPYLDRARAGDPALPTADAIARQLVRDRMLTPFQARQLLRGRHRGFFLTDKYKILELLGEGGMGRVLLCEHLLLNKLVAVKLLQMAGGLTPGAVERFLREARASAALDHPNIVRVFDVDRAGGVPFMVMDYVDGTNLHQVVAEHGPLAVDRAADYARQTALGLQHAHENGLIHRDIKPGNLLLDRSGAVRMLDLGLARFFDAGKNENLTQKFDEKSVLGTADFIAPEQAMNSSQVDIRADVYSLGCTLYYLLLRRFPFEDGSVAQKLLWHQTKVAVPVRELRPDVPEALAAALDRMMRKDPAERFQTPNEAAAALAPLAARPTPPPANEMPKVKPSAYLLGLALPPSATVVGGSQDTPSPTAVDQPTAINPSRRSAPQQYPSRPAFPPGSTPHQPSPGGTAPMIVLPPTPQSGQPLPTTGGYPSSGQFQPSGPFPPPTGLPPTGQYAAPPAGGTNKTLLAAVVVLGGLLLAVGGAVAALLLGGSGNAVVPPAPTRTTGVTPPTDPTPPPPADAYQPAAVDLTAGGSTFVAPLMQVWTQEYEGRNLGRVAYNKDATKTGSSAGIAGMLDRSFDFGCTDAPMTDTQLGGAKGGRVVHVPLAMGAVVPIYNVPDLRVQLRFTHEVLAGMYLGTITKWNDPAVAAVNPDVVLPALPIVVVHRGTKKGSGTSYIWTEFLGQDGAEKDNAVGKQFRDTIGVNTLPKWEVGTGADGNDGVATAVRETVGAVGYVELNYALDKNLPVGRVRNREGKFVQPTLEAVTAAADAAAALTDLPLDLRYSLVNPPGPDSYPITGTVWAVAYTIQQPKETRGRAVGQFLWWCTHDGQEIAKARQYAPLPPALVKRVEAKIHSILGAENVGK